MGLSRLGATALHLAITAVVLLIPAYLVVYEWYPGFFFTLDGGLPGLQVLVGVQLVVGPLLTLVVFKPGKQALAFDLVLIGLLQSGCLIGGTWVIYAERPLFFVFYEGNFYSSSAETYTRHGLDVPDYDRFSDRSPATVISLPPAHPLEEAGFRRVLYGTATPLWAYPPTYRPIAENSNRMLEQAIPVERLLRSDKHNRLDDWLERNGGELPDYSFFPIHARFQVALLGIRKSTLALVDTIEIALPPAPAEDLQVNPPQ